MSICTRWDQDKKAAVDNLSIYYAWHVHMKRKSTDMLDALHLPVPSGMKQVREKAIDLLN